MPSSATPSLDITSSPALSNGWNQWSNDGSTVFTVSAGQGSTGSGEVVSTGGSATAGLAWQTQPQPVGTAISAEVDLTSLVPTFVFADGSNLGTSTPSYLAAVVTRGANVSLIQVNNGTSTVLGTMSSPSSSYFSGNWVQLSLVPNGTSIGVQVVREDTGAFLTAQGNWQTAVTDAISASSSLAEETGDLGIGRFAAYSGAVDLENITIAPAATTNGSAINQSFDGGTTGSTPAGWQTWVSNSAGSVGDEPRLLLSASRTDIALTGASDTTAARAWSTTTSPRGS